MKYTREQKVALLADKLAQVASFIEFHLDGESEVVLEEVLVRLTSQKEEREIFKNFLDKMTQYSMQ